MEQKNHRIKLLESKQPGVPNEKIQEYQMRIAELEERAEQFERENYRLKHEDNYANKKAK